KVVTFETTRARIAVTSQGGAVQSVLLLGDKWTRHKGAKDESHVDLVAAHAGEPLPFSTMVKSAEGATLVPADASYEVVKQDATSVVLRTEQGGVTVTKTLSVNPNNYGLQLGVEVRAPAGLTGQLAVLAGAHADEPTGGLFASRSNVPARAICYYGDKKVERLAVGAKKPEFEA